MQKLFILLIVLLPLTSFAQRTDTIFLERTVAHNPYPFYHAIYVDTSSAMKNGLTDFTFKHYDSATYFEELKMLKPLKKVKTSVSAQVPKRWIALYKWKDVYCLYKPSEAGNHYKLEITDSTTIDFTMEGPEPSRLNTISKTSATHFKIDRTNHWQGQQVDINIVNPLQGIAVFTFGPTMFQKSTYKVLMVDASKAYKFPAIVNYCATDKQAEFDFDKIDFESLIK